MWFLEILELLIRRRRFIIINTLLVTILAIAVSFVLPKTFRAKTTVMPPENESPLSGLMGLSTGHIAMAVTNFALPLMATPSDLYASMMESETILKKVIDSLELATVYKSDDPWEVIESLRKDLNIRVEPEGIISIQADAKDRQLSANIANLIVSSLDELNRDMQKRKGRNYSTFLENRLAETDSALDVASQSLRSFQESNGAIALERQSEALIEQLANQKAGLITSELELDVLKKTLYPDHPEIRRLELVISEMRKSLRDIESGASNSKDSIISALDIPLARVPDLTLQFALLKRNVKIYETTYELLSQQLEMARIQERKDTPTIVVLDSARPPKYPIKPQKRMVALAAFILSSLGSALIVVIQERSSNPVTANSHGFVRIRQLIHEIKSRPLG